MNHATDAAAVKQRLLGELEQFLVHLLPNGKVHGHEYRVGSINGEAGETLAIELRGPKAGVWVDRNGQKDSGDIFGLAMAVWALDFKETLTRCCEYLGLSRVETPLPKVRPVSPDISLMGRMLGTVVFTYLADRGIAAETMKMYRLRTYGRTSEFNTNFIAFSFFAPDGALAMIKTMGVKRKGDGKKDIWSTPPWWTLWGWWLVKPHHRAIIITEGEIDAMSARQMITHDIPILSLPNGTNAMDWIENDFDALRQFEVIYLLTDADNSGEDCAKDVARRLGRTRCKRVRIPAGFKDSNDVLTRGEDVHTNGDVWIEEARTYDPSSLQRVEELISDFHALRRRHQETAKLNDFIWPSFNFQFRDGEMTLFSGYPESGKSTLLYQSHLHEMRQGKCVLMCSYEIPAAEMLNQFVKLMGIADDATETTTTDALIWLNTRLVFIRPPDPYPFETLVEDITYAIQRYGSRLIAVDSLHYLADKDDFNEQDRVVRQLHKLGIAMNVHMALVAHSPKVKDMSHIPGMMDVEGSGGIIKPVDNVLVCWRNITKEEALTKAKDTDDVTKQEQAEKAHDGLIVIRKQRLTGKHPWLKLWHNGTSFRTTREEVAPEPIPEGTDQSTMF